MPMLEQEFDIPNETTEIEAIFEISTGSVDWGAITGDINEQTDLIDLIDVKLSALGVTLESDIAHLETQLSALGATVVQDYETLDGKIEDINTVLSGFGNIVTYNADQFATAEQGALADTALQPNDDITELNNNANYQENVIETIEVNGSALTPSDKTVNIAVPTTAQDIGALPDTTTIDDLTTTAQQNALNSTATLAKINQITTNAGAIEEITASLSALGSSLSLETLDRENADIDLQQQIDAITSASDVTDIVGTYAQLQAYDTTTLPNNSIIKVLQDESQNDETTYYRWVITGGVGAWVLIGEEGPYYTKSQADSTFVPQTRTVNNKALSSNITLSASDVGAATSTQGAKADTAVQSVTTGSANGTISVDGTDVSVYGLGSAAYTNSTAYATSAQGAKADTALQATDIVSSVDSSSTNTKAVGAKLFYDTCGDIETLINAL